MGLPPATRVAWGEDTGRGSREVPAARTSPAAGVTGRPALTACHVGITLCRQLATWSALSVASLPRGEPSLSPGNAEADADIRAFYEAREKLLKARGGHLEVLEWAREHGCPWYDTTCAAAAEGGHLQGAFTCQCAARGGHLEMLQWAREHGCPWDANTRAAAAGGGHLEVLQWARDHDCP
ncbi:hypothetical protein CYMTET_35177 [Cymbomonas tetramitiformis]|uniref:Uncharacterized protein n=1 Tax=Cymbomonas tetramitiformis TaxID=36881 RepID=A0AAE0F9U3_9CHLO|nr:hypothetical protein CYMTET_35177 [Cymbomonas tetramitiformis]